VIFGVHRISIFEKYTTELLKVVEKKGKLDKQMSERTLDALSRAKQLEVSENCQAVVAKLLEFAWKSNVGKDPPPDASITGLFKTMAELEEEEDDEEEDGDFVDPASSPEPAEERKAVENTPVEEGAEYSNVSDDEAEEVTDQETS
jgi:hypothetical protein